MAPVELRMNVHCYKCAKKIRKAVANLRGVSRVTASPGQGLVVVYGTADPYVIRQLLMRKMKRPVEIVSHGSAPYYYQHTTCAPPQYYGPPPPPPPPPAGSYPYAAEGWADPDPYGYRYRPPPAEQPGALLLHHVIGPAGRTAVDDEHASLIRSTSV